MHLCKTPPVSILDSGSWYLLDDRFTWAGTKAVNRDSILVSLPYVQCLSFIYYPSPVLSARTLFSILSMCPRHRLAISDSICNFTPFHTTIDSQSQELFVGLSSPPCSLVSWLFFVPTFWSHSVSAMSMECHLLVCTQNFSSGFCQWCYSLYLPSYLNSSYLLLRRRHQKPHLSGLSWTGRRQKSKPWAAGRMNHQQSQFMGSRGGRCSSGEMCLPWHPCPLNNSKLSCYLTSQCHHSCSYEKPRESNLEVKNLHLHKAEAV